MQQGRGGFSGHPVISVGGACHNTFKETENAAHPLDAVERGHEMHLRCSRIVKQTFTSPATNVRTRLSAPFIKSLPSEIFQMTLDQPSL